MRRYVHGLVQRPLSLQNASKSLPQERTQKNEFFSTLKPLTLAKLLEPAMEEEESIYKLDADEVIRH